MVATRATRSAGKRDASSATSSSAPDVASPVSKKAKTTPLPFKSSDLESKKKALNKVTPPKASPNTSRVPHPKKLEETKKKLKVVTTSVKTSVVVKATSPSKDSPKKAASSPSKSPLRVVSPVKRPRSADK